MLGFLAMTLAAQIPAHAASSAAMQGKHFIILISKNPPQVISAHCYTGAVPASALSGTLLMTIYDDADYLGSSTQIRGDSGPCDSKGYGIADLDSWTPGSWRNEVSSFKTWNGCYVVNAYTYPDCGGIEQTYNGDTHWVGDRMNDDIDSFTVHSTR